MKRFWYQGERASGRKTWLTMPEATKKRNERNPLNFHSKKALVTMVKSITNDMTIAEAILWGVNFTFERTKSCI